MSINVKNQQLLVFMTVILMYGSSLVGGRTFLGI